MKTNKRRRLHIHEHCPCDFSPKMSVILPLDRMNPPITRTVSSAHDPNVFATMTFLPRAPMNRNSPEAIWLTQMSRNSCLKNLQIEN